MSVALPNIKKREVKPCENFEAKSFLAGLKQQMNNETASSMSIVPYFRLPSARISQFHVLLPTWLFVVCLFTGLFVPSTARGQEKAATKAYDRHFVVMVDQTVFYGDLEVKRHVMGNLYSALTNWLSGKTSFYGLTQSESSVQDIAPFDPKRDQLSVFAFALQGHAANGGPCSYRTVNAMSRNTNPASSGVGNHSVQNYSDEEVYLKLVERLISPRGEFQSSPLPFTSFCNAKLRPLFNGTDPLFARIRGSMGAITLSYYVYPLIFDRLGAHVPSQQFILITVSDFNSGSFNENASQDRAQLYDVLARNKERMNYVTQRVARMKKPYAEVELARFVADQGNVHLVARATAVTVKQSVLHSPIFLASNVKLDQQKGKFFRLSSATVSFNKDKAVHIDSVEVVISQTEDGQVLCRKSIDKDDLAYSDQTHECEIGSLGGLNLQSANPDDLTITYNFYTHATSDGEDLLPFVYTAQRILESSDITLINKILIRNMMLISIFLFIFIILVMLLYRGREKRIALRIGNFAQKFTKVSEAHGAEELPCWFYGGPTDSTRRIRVDGALMKAKVFALGMKTTVKVRLQNTQPAQGFTYYVEGRQITQEWMPVVKTDHDSFKVILQIQVDPTCVDSEEATIVSADIDVLVESSVFGVWRHQDVDNTHTVKFYFTRDLGTAWVGFDPGTTGSCVAYGNTGGTLDDPAIRMVKDEYGQIITPSYLALDRDFGQRSLSSLEPGKDYKYGSQADANARAWRNSNTPTFRSIKKLLGYQNEISARLSETNTRTFRGVDLAHLLVKGLERNLQEDVEKLSPSDRLRFVGETQGQAKRAVVAIPNNYTLPKILDMVGSIERLPEFREVRFVYEAEAVLFNYLSKNFSKQKPGTENVMIFDMGGATINLSVFRVHYEDRGGTLFYQVETLGRIGYGVGGDNIDVALMEHLLKFPEVGAYVHTEKRRRYELEHKEDILPSILTLKKDVIRYKSSSIPDKNSVLLNGVTFKKFMDQISGQRCQMEIDEYNCDDTCSGLLLSNELESYVYRNITDVVSEIMNYPNVKGQGIQTIIFSGRSTLFPLVKERVKEALVDHLGKERMPKLYRLDDSEVKTAVAYGACWYGIYNSLVTLDNSRLSSAYGFKLTGHGKAQLNVLLKQNCRFGENGWIANSVVGLGSTFAADGNQVNFYQIMGSGTGDDLFSESNRHKVNYIGTLPATAVVEEVEMSVSRQDIVTCKVTYDNGAEMSVNNIQVQGRDITDENDWAYVFATTSSTQAVNASVSKRPATTRVKPTTTTSDAKPSAELDAKPSAANANQGHAASEKKKSPASMNQQQNRPYVPRNIKRI